MNNINSIATCEIETQVRGSRFDLNFVTNLHRYQRSGELVRWDQLTRGQRRQGVISEDLAQIYFDGSQTIQVTINLAGLAREFSALQPRGMRCQISPGLHQRLNDAFILEVLRMNAFAVGESLSFAQVPVIATSATVVGDANSTSTVRYSLPDLTLGDQSYTARFVEFDFDREHGSWISHARFGATPNSGDGYSGGLRISEFHDLGSGRFFPKEIAAYSRDPSGNEKPGPVTEVTLCRINEPVSEAMLVLETPIGLPISVEVQREGDLHISKLRLISAAGETKEFEDHDEFGQFVQTTQGQDQWTGSYVPPTHFDYYFKDAKQAKALLQQSLGTDSLPNLRTSKSREGQQNGSTPSGAVSTEPNKTSYLLWIGLGMLAIVGFFTIQNLARAKRRS